MAKQRKRKNANLLENALGVQGLTAGSAFASDMFTNAGARQGFGTPSLGQGASYELIRLSYDYWQLITLYRNHWISRRIVEVPAQDMVKAWPKLTSEIEPKDLTRIDRAIRKTNTKNNVLTGLTWGRLFGGAGGLIVIKGQENELDQPLDLDSVGIGAYKGIIPFDRWAGISPLGDVCGDIERPLDFNKPEMYEVRVTGGASFQVHSSRLLRFLGPSVPTPELEAQSYWGISVLEPTYESITMLDNTMWNILGLTFRANILGMKFPELAQLLSGLGSSQMASQKFEGRISAINHLISNQSLIPLPADGGIESTQYSFGGLEGIFQLFQLNLAGAAQMPVTRLFGRTYTGLGQNGDGDERIYEEKIATDQSTYLAPQLEKLFPVVCMSELGEVPDDLDLNFPSIRVLDEKEKSELAKATADTVTVYMNGGIFSPRVAGREVKQSSDLTGIGTNLTDEEIEKLSDKVQAEGEIGEGLFGEEGEGGGLNPSSGPSKAVKEENKAGEKEKKENDEPEAEDLSEKAGKAADTAPAMDVLPAGLKPGEKVLVHGKLLTVDRVLTGQKDLFDQPVVYVVFTAGDVVAYKPNADVKMRAEDGKWSGSAGHSDNPTGPRDTTRIKRLHKDAVAAFVKSGRKTSFEEFLKNNDPQHAKEILAYDKTRATDAIGPTAERCGRPRWRTCPACNGRIHLSTCAVKLHHDRDCVKERGCPYSLLVHGKGTNQAIATDAAGVAVTFMRSSGDVQLHKTDCVHAKKNVVGSGQFDSIGAAIDHAHNRGLVKDGDAKVMPCLRAKERATDEDGASSATQSAQALLDYHALPVRIENRAGDARSGVTPDGESWQNNMPADYGFIEGVNGADGDSIDCYVGPSPESSAVYVVDQYDLDGEKFDEHKVMLGYHTEDSAKEDYMLGHHMSSKTFAAITPFTMPMFRRWLNKHDMTQPCDPGVRQ